jgi:hypothetical protein
LKSSHKTIPYLAIAAAKSIIHQFGLSIDNGGCLSDLDRLSAQLQRRLLRVWSLILCFFNPIEELLREIGPCAAREWLNTKVGPADQVKIEEIVGLIMGILPIRMALQNLSSNSIAVSGTSRQNRSVVEGSEYVIEGSECSFLSPFITAAIGQLLL